MRKIKQMNNSTQKQVIVVYSWCAWQLGSRVGIRCEVVDLCPHRTWEFTVQSAVQDEEVSGESGTDVKKYGNKPVIHHLQESLFTTGHE